MYTLDKLIYHPVILVFKYSVGSFSVVFFVVFQKLKKNCIEDILEFIDKEIKCNQDKTCIEISTAVLVLYHIGDR